MKHSFFTIGLLAATLAAVPFASAEAHGHRYGYNSWNSAPQQRSYREPPANKIIYHAMGYLAVGLFNLIHPHHQPYAAAHTGYPVPIYYPAPVYASRGWVN